ncbi:RimJ/RimL family protein N-acetyltransferase [Pseudomonas sp. BIGb0450]|jgi:RimJ/RimL family protein N-acetyltransferase|uniref:GNAT family N-acetyltransferase n=1 Tax=unclassified Pseudomonas TaxID=196821 RepID=UPI0021681232|nr:MULTISPECIES: GNAT family N-acetyltransferase [unclassified Pseudomonas]MCS3418107.1 RimJ/RimL family protein N-acetyltransferase [Pseudomonas sp. BIGb0558]MCS3437645.1 RimJ/RimL family protein N-acetyltransferase [Pseudomonas sp. BIGb0450]
MELYTERLYMRQLEAGDWDFFLALHTDPSVIQYVCDVPSETETREKFETRLPRWLPGASHWLCLVVFDRHSGCAVGVTGLKRVPDEHATAEVGYLFLSGHHGKGYGFESLQRLMTYGRETLGLNALMAVVTEGNAASCRLLEKCGFLFEQRHCDAYQINGQLFDDLIYRAPLEP